MPRQVEVAKELGLSRERVSKLAKSRGMSNKELTDEDVKELKSNAELNQFIKETNENNVKKLHEASEKFKPNVRRIDLINYSSIENVLQDAKDRYVKNEEIIQRLQNELDTLEVTMNSNVNGTVSTIPQLPMIEKYVKLNIALRSQILDIEDKLGRHGKADDNDPFK